MKKTAQILMLLVLSLGICGFSGCGKICGKWAYNHDPETVILALDKNGSAEYKGRSYQYEADKNFIELRDETGAVTRLRYRKEGDTFLLYEPTVYDYQGNGKAERLPGRWVSEDHLSFEFTASGKFCEDDVFTGIYRLDTEGTQFTLDYNEDFEDTVCFYTIENNQLRVEYPWRLVKAK